MTSPSITGHGVAQRDHDTALPNPRGVFTLVRPGSRVSVTPWTVTADARGNRVLNVGFPTIELRTH